MKLMAIFEFMPIAHAQAVGLCTILAAATLPITVNVLFTVDTVTTVNAVSSALGV